MNIYFDCHMHEINGEHGGLLIAVGGMRGSEGGYSNADVKVKAGFKKGIIPVQYIDNQFCATDTAIVKYHPRRERYLVEDVKKDIEHRKPKAVIIDTLNQPYWQPADYWRLVSEFSEIPFLLSHSGGYDMLQFLNMTTYVANAWIDFSFVQHVFGMCGNNIPLKQIVELMQYGLSEKKIYSKLMFGTDNIRGEKDVAQEVLKVYSKYGSYEQVIKENFLNFISML